MPDLPRMEYVKLDVQVLLWHATPLLDSPGVSHLLSSQQHSQPVILLSVLVKQLAQPFCLLPLLNYLFVIPEVAGRSAVLYYQPVLIARIQLISGVCESRFQLRD